MASRLDSPTRLLYAQVTRCLRQLGLASLGSPTLIALTGLYVTGLILLHVHQTQTRVTRFLPGRCHDALDRLLRVMPLSPRALMTLLIRWVQRYSGTDYLCLDDVVVDSRRLSALAPQAFLLQGGLSPQAATGRGDAHRDRGGAAGLRLPGR